MKDPFIRCPICKGRLHSEFGDCFHCEDKAMYTDPPYISEEHKRIDYNNPISGHNWTEHGETSGYTVRGGGWMPTEHKTLKGAEKEVALRLKILAERKERGK